MVTKEEVKLEKEVDKLEQEKQRLSIKLAREKARLSTKVARQKARATTKLMRERTKASAQIAKASAKLATARAKSSASKFNQELKKAIETALAAAFGFIIALAWRDLIKEYVSKITGASPVQGLLVEAVIVTIIAVIGIIVVTKFLSKEKEPEKK